MRIAIAQINTAVADFSGNMKKILDFAWKAKNEYKPDLILFPALSVCGSPAASLLKQKKFIDLNAASLKTLRRELPGGMAAGLGYVNDKGKNVYGVFLDSDLIFERSFNPKKTGKPYIFEYLGESIAITPLAVPYETGKFKNRLALAERKSFENNVPLVCVNAVGANDSIIYEGRSFAASPVRGAALTAKAFEEDLVIWNWPEINMEAPAQNRRAAEAENKKKLFGSEFTGKELDELEEALVLGIRDYMKKSGFKKAHLGLSGGIDSALVAYLGVKAAGAENFTCISMPSRFSSRGSKDDAKELAENLGCRYEVLPIEPVFEAFLSSLEGVFEKKPFDVAEENLQSRIRGTLLMGFSNKWNSMLLTNGNKSELAMGYCTLYGDTNGALGPIGDIFKTEVFALCERINERAAASGGRAIIPRAIIDKPPSAELRPDQKDEDSLPPYETLDAILRLYLYKNMAPEEIALKGLDGNTAARIIRSVTRNEFKRRQCPPVLRVSRRPFGGAGEQPINRALFELD